MQNAGKKFENAFKGSVPDFCLCQRLNDAPQAFRQSELTRFTPKNPCDFFVFDSRSHLLYTLELKSTKNTSMTFEDISSEEKQSKLIHKHQILGLLKFSRFDGVVSGFIFNFRDEKNGTEKTYFHNIKDFMEMYKGLDKFSFNEKDLLEYNGIEIKGSKKRVNYTWDIEDFLCTHERELYYG